jgi:hypothetical protein
MRSQLISGFQLALFWSTILRSPSGELRLGKPSESATGEGCRAVASRCDAEAGLSPPNELRLGKPSVTYAAFCSAVIPLDSHEHRGFFKP